MKNAGAGEECVEREVKETRNKGTKWMGGEDVRRQRHAGRKRQRQDSERRTAVKEAKEKGRDKV